MSTDKKLRKELRRQDITFEKKDQPLKDDVRILGTLVGELLRDQGGNELFELVENARQRSIQRRENDEYPGEKLSDLVRNLDLSLSIEVIRAFSTYFQMVNTAEKVHRIRRRREYLQNYDQYQPGGLEDTLVKLKTDGFCFDNLKTLLNRLRIQPVFTAHPTEPTRRTILRKEQNIVRQLIEMLNPAMTAKETKICLENIRLDMTTGWQTGEHPSEQMTVSDELEHILFFMTDVLYKAIPPFYEDLENTIERVYGLEEKKLKLPPIVQFASWVGGDMDGNPNVNAKTIRSTLARQRSLILDLYYQECSKLSEKLSQSKNRLAFDAQLLAKIEKYRIPFQHAYHNVPARHRDMPYRVFLRLVQERLQATYDDDAYPYESASELYADIALIADSLETNKGQNAGLFSVKRLLRRIETFGFHFMTLDIRQEAKILREVVGELLGIDNWMDVSPAERAAHIKNAIESQDSLPFEQSVLARKTLRVFQTIATCRRKYGHQAIGLFIVSMTEGADDILSVLLLANWSELHHKHHEVPLDIVPLLETVDDLDQGPNILRDMLDDQLYCEHLQQRDNQQTIMIGYSDSNKDSGLASARWALQKAQVNLVQTVSKKNIDLHLFHGRGGTISRGGGKTHKAVLASPPGTVNGHLRVTEQGEIINEKYGLRGIALRTLEQMSGSVALATALPEHNGHDKPQWHDMMQVIADVSRQTYRSLVFDTPEFYEYFRLATPIDLIERMRIGSRPASRGTHAGLAGLRAIPWVFAWTQNRLMLPGWFGFGSGLQAASKQFNEQEFHDMYREWYFMRALSSDAELVLAKADLGIANLYSELAGELHELFFPVIHKEFELTRDLILKYSDEHTLLERDSTLQRAIMLRNPYVDPMSLMQIDLLRRWRSSDYDDTDLFEALLASVNGIAQGLQNTG
mgnify:CR=1 FL=1